ncbi:MAG: prepilin peptidase [Mogibacterium sp.]|nr:prepilin peptidase [Mogibacterium sp.]
MDYRTEFIIRIAIAIAFAVIMGNGSVVAFNRMPAKWFEDYDENAPRGEEPHRVMPEKLLEADAMGRQRLPSTPWKYAFVGFFMMSGLYLAIRGGGIAYEISVLCVLFIVLEMAVSDCLYQVVPDQFSWGLIAIAISFNGYFDKWWEQAAGALTGLGLSFAILILGNILFKTGSIGGADIKFFGCMGLITGSAGVIIIFVLTTVLFAVYSMIKIAAGQGSIKDRNAMLPAGLAAVTIYLLFLWNIGDLLVLKL